VQTGDSLLVREFEAQSLGVVAQNLNVGELEVNPSLVPAGENLGTVLRGLCNRGGSTRVIAVQSRTNTH
jgi:hypothetical protein